MKKQKIVICSSASFEKEIIELKEKLEKKDFEGIKYPIKLNRLSNSRWKTENLETNRQY